MNKIKKAHYQFVRKNLESKDKDTQEGIKRILKLRAKYIKLIKATDSLYGANHLKSVVYGIELSLWELGMSIKRYGG